MRRVLLIFAVLASAALWAQSAAAEGALKPLGQDLWGKEVESLEFKIPPWMSDNEIRRVNKIKEGAQLERWRVRATIRRVYLLGYVENVVVKARALDGGKVHVRLEVFPRYQVRDVTVKGNYKLNDVEIIEDVLKMEMGDDFRVEDVPRLEQKLRDAYRDVGNLKADVKINVELTKLKLDNKADITIEVNERPTFRVVKIDLYGDLVPYSRSRLLRVLKWKEGMDYERERIDTGLNRLKTWLKKRQHYEARVSDIELDDEETADVNEDQSEITLKLRVDVGPRVEILYDDECFTCAQKKWKLDKHLDVENNRRFTRYIVEPYAESIEQYFRLRGYLDAAVTGEFEGGVDEDGRPVKRLLFLMDKGRKYKIEDIDFKNNPSYSDGDLEDEMDQGKYFLPEDFDKNLENAVAFYNRNGYIQAKVIQKSAEIDEGTGEIFLTVVMSEGPQAIINSVTLNGNEVLPDKKFAVTLEEQDLVPGLPYNPFLVAETKTRMIAKYLGRGYLKARIREKIKISEDGTKVDVVYDFVEGRQYFFGNVYVHGNKLTKKHVITRELFITSGDPFNYEDVFASQQQLMKLGFFNSVKIEPVNPDVDEEVVDLIVDVDERNAGYIQTGVGYNTYNGYQGAFELGHKNLAGHGRSIAFRTDVNFRDETFLFDQRLVAITFGWPWVARLPMDGELTLADDQRNLIGYDLRSLSATVALKVEFPKLFYNLRATRQNEVVRSLSKYWAGRLAYAYAREFLFNIDDAVSDQDPGEIQIATISPQVTRDSRDSAFDPTTGKVYMGMLEWGSPPLLSEINYLKAIGQFSYYFPFFKLFDRRASKGVVLAWNVKAGHAQVLRETDTLPINRRFYLGGSSTIRGFGQDEISPKGEDERTPVGGYFFAYQNSEVRMPIADTGFGLLFFFDSGNVTDQFKEFYIDKMRATSGMGFRYLTPVGPISADYGIKLNREPEETIGEFYITVGNAF